MPMKFQGTNPQRDFQLIETLRWTPADGYYLLGLHLERLQRSASELGFACDLPRILQELEVGTRGHSMPRRVRLLLHTDGHTDLTTHPFELSASGAPVRCALSHKQVDSRDPLLRHKTTRRALFDDEHRYFHEATGADEVLFTNEKGQLTEGSRSSLFVRVGNRLLTPPLDSGLLDGVLRRHLLRTRADVFETPLSPDDMATAEQLFVGNSLRGLRPAIYPGQS